MSEGINKDSTNVLIIGKSGVGKSSLLNYIFGRELQKVGVGAPVTKMEIKKFTYKYDDHFEMHIYDTWGLEPSVQKAEDWKNTIFKEIGRHDEEKISEWFNTIIFCLNAKSARVEDFEIDIMEELLREKNHVTIALTHCNSKSDPDGIVLRESVKEELTKQIPPQVLNRTIAPDCVFCLTKPPFLPIIQGVSYIMEGSFQQWARN